MLSSTHASCLTKSAQGRKVKKTEHTCKQAAIGRELEPTSVAQLIHYGTAYFLILTISIVTIDSILL